MKQQKSIFVTFAELTSYKLAYQKYHLTLMPNVGQLICAWNSFAINTVELKQRTTKRKTKTVRNATEVRIRFNESKRDQTFASYRIFKRIVITVMIQVLTKVITKYRIKIKKMRNNHLLLDFLQISSIAFLSSLSVAILDSVLSAGNCW